LTHVEGFLRDLGVDLSECLDPPESLDTPRKVFERKIRYWECRPMPEEVDAVLAPADARVLVGSLSEASQIAIKDKFFTLDELLGADALWIDAFRGGDFAVFRLTPEKYHYNHVPVTGRVVDVYTIDGAYHACNPQAAVTLVTPYSKNRRVVTVIDTDVQGGATVGLVAMIEVVALMIGQIAQCYSRRAYDDPVDVRTGMFVQRGAPKSLFRPGSSTTLLLLQPDRCRFAEDLVANLRAPAASRFSAGFARPLVETDVMVRSPVAYRR
jgi:phosphatidylserine decarboxylase